MKKFKIQTLWFEKMMVVAFCCPLWLPLFRAAPAVAATEGRMVAYIGTYTGKRSQGIYVASFDSATGKFGTPRLAAETKNPSFLAVHPNRRVLYAVGELDSFQGQKAGGVSAFGIDMKTGNLTLLNQQPSGGTGPCHLSVANSRKLLLVANYGSGSIAALPIESDGKLGPASKTIQHEGSSIDARRQEGPHAHFITPDAQNRFALACDLGLDKVLAYRLEPAPECLIANDPPACSIKAGSGPRHLAFHPSGRWVYVINEMASTVTVLTYDGAKGIMTEIQTASTLPAEFKGQNTCAEIQAHPSGKFVYGSNRGHDSIAVFAVDAASGKLTSPGHQATQGKTPRHFAIDPAGKWLVAENQDSDSMVVFKIDPKSGGLTSTQQTAEVGAPVCLVFVPLN